MPETSTIPDSERRIVPRMSIHPWPMQPRKNFDLDYLNQLAASIEKYGILNDLLCRPRAGHDGELEIIGGECRWRAAEMAGKDEVPVKVHDLTDGDALELALVDNMKRKDLSELEECDAFHNAMAQTDERGIPRYASHRELAAKIDVSPGYVEQRLWLRKLTKEGREALAAGRISFKTARVVCGKPATLVESILDVILHPKKHGVWFGGFGYATEPLNAEQTEEVIRSRFVRNLREAPFQLNDAKLLPIKMSETNERTEGGACADCPWNSATAENGAKKRASERFCLNPACFTRKVEIHTAAAVVKAKEGGCRILSEKEADRIMYDSGKLKHDSPFVPLNERPGYEDRNQKIEEKKTPTWEKIVTGEAAPPVVVAIDKNGNVHKLVERKLAVAAAQKNGTAHFLNLSSGGARSAQKDDYDRRQAAERAEQKIKATVALDAVGEVIAKIAAEDLPDGFWAWLLNMGKWHGGSDGVTFVAKRRNLTGSDAHKAIDAEARRMKSVGEKRALAVELLIGRLVKFGGSNDAHFKELAGLYKVDVAAIDKRIREAAKEKKAVKAKDASRHRPVL
jgi:ParB/RepB/Spo0J family partition protein